MKKLITVILILALAVPIAASADDQDPIIGCWYMCIDAKDSSQDVIDEGYLYEPTIFLFTPGGQILFQRTEFKESSGTVTDVTYIGKWSKKDDKYFVSIISVGENEALLYDNVLAACVLNPKQYILLQRMIPFDVYNGIYNLK